MRCKIIAELATNHGGDIALAKDMITAAADAGADIVKTQAYNVEHLRRSDPQYEWFLQSQLSFEDHDKLMNHAQHCGVEYLTTAYHIDDLDLVERLGLSAVKIGSGEGRTELVKHASTRVETVYASLPWGLESDHHAANVIWFATVPLYPTPPEAYAACKHHHGWSDHCVGLDIAKFAIAHGVAFVEKHFQIDGRGRNQPWNMNADDVRELRRWADVCVLAEFGTKYEGRWTA